MSLFNITVRPRVYIKPNNFGSVDTFVATSFILKGVAQPYLCDRYSLHINTDVLMTYNLSLVFNLSHTALNATFPFQISDYGTVKSIYITNANLDKFDELVLCFSNQTTYSIGNISDASTYILNFVYNKCIIDNGACPQNSTCIFHYPGDVVTCSCNSGYTRIGSKCIPVVCVTNNGNCPLNSLCTFDGLQKVCQCNSGYTNSNGSCIVVIIDPCLTSNGNCPQNSQCTFDGVQKSCPCSIGYEDTGSCTPINSCVSNNGGCAVNSACTPSGPNINDCKCNAHYYSPSNSQKDCAPINNCKSYNGGCEQVCIYIGPGDNDCS